jgi:hypothetical protein
VNCSHALKTHSKLALNGYCFYFRILECAARAAQWKFGSRRPRFMAQQNLHSALMKGEGLAGYQVMQPA